MKDNKNINNKLKEIPSGHKLKTRRDFLSHGLLSMSASTVMPSVFSMLYSRLSFAQECGMTANEMSQAQGLPVIVFDLAGGANIPGSNVMVGGPGGQSDFLQTYETLGLPQDMHPSNPGQLNEDLGLKFHADSSMLRGIMSNINAQMSAKVDGGVFATSSSDDTGNNPHNPMYWLANAGANGKLSALAGTNGNESGGRSMAPPESINPTLQPVKIETPQEALGLVNVGRLDELFNRDKAEKVNAISVSWPSIEEVEEYATRSAVCKVSSDVAGFLDELDAEWPEDSVKRKRKTVRRKRRTRGAIREQRSTQS